MNQLNFRKTDQLSLDLPNPNLIRIKETLLVILFQKIFIVNSEAKIVANSICNRKLPVPRSIYA